MKSKYLNELADYLHVCDQCEISFHFLLGMSDPYCILTHCNKASSSPAQQRSSHHHSHKGHARSDSFDQLLGYQSHQPMQHSNTLPLTSANSSAKFLSPQTSLPEATHHLSLNRNVQRNRSFNRKDRRRKSLEHLGLGR